MRVVHLAEHPEYLFSRHDAQDLLTKFDLYGLAVSSGSACRARASRSSYVIEALGYEKERARVEHSIQFGLADYAKDDISGALKIIKKRSLSLKT